MAQCNGDVKHKRTVNGNERDCYMGHVPGVTQYKVDEKGNFTEVSDRYRHGLLGKGLHAYEQMCGLISITGTTSPCA